MINTTVISQVEGNIVSDMDGEKVMLSIQNGKYYNLGQVGGDIWSLIKDPISVQQIVSSLQSIYDISQKECEEQVISFLEKLQDEGLILAKEMNHS
ncbi:lasso peptide biosynthesis PqqD family chaperone [Peribacillus asahii]|uniref:lasso peptide biosynthesis PqqD family chaperone n=1 Tax=Peribacillus asahii TaxID=228899 RepID=UPI00380ED2CA